MCLLAFAWQQHPKYPLLLIANRDEWHRRPTRPLQFREDAPDVLGGMDLQAGGSWLELSTRGRLAAVTNVRVAAPPAARSRGELVSAFSAGFESLPQFAAARLRQAGEYGPFNLLLVEPRQARFLSNRPQPQQRPLAAGVYGLSNGGFDENWPKLRRLREQFSDVLQQPEPTDAGWFELLADRQPAADAELPDTGIGLQAERRLSAIFIAGEDYGTRSSSVVLWSADGWRFGERRFGPQGRVIGERWLAGGWR